MNISADEAWADGFFEALDALKRKEKVEVLDDALHKLNFERRLASLTDKQLEHMNGGSLSDAQRERIDNCKTDEAREEVIEGYARAEYFKECLWIDYLNGDGKIPIKDSEQL